MQKEGEEFVLPLADQSSWQEEIRYSYHPAPFRNTRDERSTRMFFKGNSDGSQPSDEQTDDVGARDDF